MSATQTCPPALAPSLPSVSSPPLPNVSSSLQSIAELNRSSNGGSSKRISLDSSHLDSSRDTDSGTPFSSPTSKPSKPASDTDDGWVAPLRSSTGF